MKKYFLEDLEKLGVYELAFKNWCNNYSDLIHQKFQEHCNSFEIYFDSNGNVSWEDGEFVSDLISENETRHCLKDLNSETYDKALKNWIYSYEDIIYESFENYCKAFRVYFDEKGNILGEDE